MQMKLKNLFNLLVLGSALTMTAAGCRTTPQGTTVIPGDRMAAKDPGPLADSRPISFNPPPMDRRTDGGIPPTPPPDGSDYTEDKVSLAKDTAYFDFDKSAIKSSEQGKLEDVANYLKGNGVVKVRVEGNCDERGTEEYNRSLGERRALSAREYLVRLGVDSQRVITLTKGEDNPAVPGHSEEAWAKHRRDEFIILIPANPR